MKKKKKMPKIINSNLETKFKIFFKRFSKIIIKVGSSLLVNQKNGKLNLNWMNALAEDISVLKNINKKIILVSSGAIAIGRKSINVNKKTLTLEENQAAAAVGQVKLAHAWQNCLAKEEMKCAQVLLSPDDTETRRRHLNARATLSTLLKNNIIPVINENDTVTTSEIRFGDNDRLAARVAQMSSSDLLILLSDIDGLYDSDPKKNDNAKHIPIVEKISNQIMKMAGSKNYEYASGGMHTKLEAAKIANISGCKMIICDGKKNNPLKILSSGDKHTLFNSAGSPLSARKSWIAAGLKNSGRLIIDPGAVKALYLGSSLLPAGVVEVKGIFERGDLIELVNSDGEVFASGLSGYGSKEAKLLAGQKTTNIKNILGYAGREELIHRDDLVMREKNERK